MAAAVAAFRHLSLALSAAVAALGSLLFIAWKVYFRDADDSCVGWRSRWERQLEAELRACNVRKEAEQPHYCEYQVLMLGLDGAGKSTILHYVCSPEAKKHIAPTQGFNSVQLHASGLQMDLLEVGGSQNLRFYWNQYLSKAHILVFVVDSADGPRLHIARQELHCLLAEDPQLPLIVLANKQDKNGALSVAELQEELALHNLDSQRKFFLLPTSATYAGLATANSVLQLKHLLVKILGRSSKMDSL
ncbi:PREDICTED: ADP-ribosylation factor-like protein 10 isoform X1 [Thamnophis sirtalis]|uniref:ADP-ribosylation factor-like protein 10 isoform X1 n=1 Tax=Thamnophis sirtalis TaxID=35019 RepID=A0A6I9Y6Q8_9SAUR|nr:PREDICTED: ADP-ribosylation factor-like protein 10 isoform X1 [Thamnophis sirtalis]